MICQICPQHARGTNLKLIMLHTTTCQAAPTLKMRPECRRHHCQSMRRGGGMARAACRAASGPASTRSIFFLFGITSNTLARSIRFIRACLRRIRRLWAGTRSCGPGPQVYDYRGRGAPSHHLGRIHPYVLSCSAIGTDRERGDCVWNH